MLASSITQLHCESEATSSEALLFYVRSYGAQIKNEHDLNAFLAENLGAIQYMVHSQTNVCNNFCIIKYLQFPIDTYK